MSAKAETSELRNKEMTDFKKNYKTLQDHVIKLESHSRRDNLLMDGLTENANETDTQCTDKVYDIVVSKFRYAQARNNIKIVRYHHLDKRSNTRPHTVIFKLWWYEDREYIWNDRSKLKNSQIWLQEDFPTEIQMRRKILQPIMQTATSQGKRASLNVGKLIINGSVYAADSLSVLLEEPLELTGKLVSHYSSLKSAHVKL